MENGIKYLLGAFITLILGIALLSVYADLSLSKTSTTTQAQSINIAAARIAGGAINTSVPFTLTNGYNTWRSDYASECLPSALLSYVNNTGSDLTVTTDYVYYSTNGSLYLKNTNAVNNTGSNVTTATYTYCGEGYLPSGFGNSMLKITVGLLAVLLLVATVGFMYEAMKEMGLNK